MLLCRVNSHRFILASPVPDNSAFNRIHASPQPTSFQHLPHSHFSYIHNSFISNHLRTLQKNTGGMPNPSHFGTRQTSAHRVIVVFSPRSSISRRLSQNDPLALQPVLAPA